jgi:protein-export membrane protein SecD
MKLRGSLFWYGVAFLLSIFIIVFVRLDALPWWATWYSLGMDWWKSFRKGMDVAGGVRLNYKIDLSKYKEAYPNPQEYLQVTNNVKNIILKNIDWRISQLWVSDYESYIQTIWEEQFLVIEIGGVANLEEAKGLIWKTVELEFKSAYEGDWSELLETRQILAEDILKQAVVLTGSFESLATIYQNNDVYYSRYDAQTQDELPEIYAKYPTFFEQPNNTVYPRLLQWVHSVIPPLSGFTTEEVTIKWRTIAKLVATTILSWDQLSGEVAGTTYTVEELVVRDTPTWQVAKDPVTNEILNGAYFKFASVWQSQLWQPVTTIQFDEKWKQIFCNLTEKIVWKQLAIFVWWTMVTAPVIREKICWWSAQIDGQFTPESAKQLVNDLNEWALPAALILSNEEKVSPKLWESALQWAIIVGVVWLILVFIYMLFAYSLMNAIISVITLVFFLTLLFAFIKLIWYPLSLSGLAAILLSIWVGVDANILVYERVIEEIKHGSRAQEAINEWYKRSWSAILDANMTSLLIAFLLLFIWTNVFKWFGTMQIVTILFALLLMVPLIKQLLLFVVKKKE